MNSVLVAVTDEITDAHALETAIRQAERTGGRLVVVHVLSPGRYEAHQDSIHAIGALRRDGATFTLEQAEERARFVADSVARTAIGERDVPFVAVGAVGGVAPVLSAIATAYDCDTIVLTAQRSRWRRLVDTTARRIRRAFPGEVISVSQRAPEDPAAPRPPAPRHQS